MGKIKQQKKIDRRDMKNAKLLLNDYNTEIQKYENEEFYKRLPKLEYNKELNTFIFT